MKTLTFKIQGQTELHTGTATIVPINAHAPHTWMREDAESFFETEDLTIRSIGTIVDREHSQSGYEDTYEVFESYVDSGSDDYLYYAIAISSREI